MRSGEKIYKMRFQLNSQIFRINKPNIKIRQKRTSIDSDSVDNLEKPNKQGDEHNAEGVGKLFETGRKSFVLRDPPGVLKVRADEYLPDVHQELCDPRGHQVRIQWGGD